MIMREGITFAVAVNDRDLLERNLLASPHFNDRRSYPLLIQKGFASAAAAYNDAIEKSATELIVFCHQDMFFPGSWIADLRRALDHLERHDPEWGVLGCWGITANGNLRGYLYSSGLGPLGQPFQTPQPVQTLDEIVLIMKKSSGLRFDRTLPSFHLYGTDICLRAAEAGRNNYAIPAFCFHNEQYRPLPADFYRCCSHVRRAWKRHLPINTTCVRLTSLNLDIYIRRAREACSRYLKPKPIPVTRVDDVALACDRLSIFAEDKSAANQPVSTR